MGLGLFLNVFREMLKRVGFLAEESQLIILSLWGKSDQGIKTEISLYH